MDACEVAFRLREKIDMHCCHLSMSDLLYGKVTAELRNALWDDILKLNLDEVNKDCYLKCRELMDKQWRYVLEFGEELRALLMCIEKQRYNVATTDDHIDG